MIALLLFMSVLTIRPQPGPQERFLSTPADIAITGGGAYGGKTFSIVLDPLRHVDNPKFGAVFFRRTMPQITNEGGLWDEAKNMYIPLGAQPRTSPKHDFVFPSGAKITFSHMQLADDRFDWDGSQIAAIYFDQLEHFEEIQFWYMLSRNRSTCGVKPYIRATCNPDADTWLAKLLQWYWEPSTGYAIPERSGIIRWLIRDKGEIVWGNSRDELKSKYPDSEPKSFTFIPSSIHDNKIALAANPGALANLMALPHVEQERLLKGNWKIKLQAGDMFKRSIFERDGGIQESAPNDLIKLVRYWDKGFTAGGAAFSVGTLRGLQKIGERDGFPLYNGWTLDVKRGQWGSDYRDRMIYETAQADESKYGKRKVCAVFEQEPGGQGRDSVTILQQKLKAFWTAPDPVKEDKTTRARAYSSQHLAGNEYLVKGNWNEEFIAEHDSFPFGKYKDQVDSASGGFNWQMLSRTSWGSFNPIIKPKANG